MRTIPKPFRLMVLLLVLAWLSACATTKMESVTVDDTYSGGPIKKILIVGMAYQSKYRLKFEKVFEEAFGKRGVEAVASRKVIILINDLTKDRIVREAQKMGADTVLITTVIGVKDKYLTYDPANVQRATYSKLSWDWVNTYASEPVTYTETESVRLSTSIFELKTEKLIWNGISETVQMVTAEELIESLCTTVIKDIRKRGFIQ